MDEEYEKGYSSFESKREKGYVTIDEGRKIIKRSKSQPAGEKHKKKTFSTRRKMDKNTRRHFITLLDTNPDSFLQELSSGIKANSNEKVRELLTIMENKCSPLHCMKQYREGEDKSETLLHMAVKYEDDFDIIKRIIDLCPDLLSLARETSENYQGQTPLHIAITRGDDNVTELLLSSSNLESERKQYSSRTKLTMINTPAVGRIFANTVMMGELPLSVAALTFNETIVDLLLDHGANMHSENSCGDTVLHSLVKYAAVYPNKTDNVINMFTYLIERMRENNTSHGRYQGIDTDIFLKEDSYVWFLKNDEFLTPLQLSAKLGVVEIFQFIINLENVYSFVSTHDGLFDVKLYDITEIDTVANHHVASTTTANEGYGSKKVSRNIDGVSRTSIKSKTNCNPFKCSQFDNPETESILEMMFDFDYQSHSAFRIIETIPVKNIILEKWQKLRYIYFIWGFLHVLMTVFLTMEIVIRSELYALKTASNTSTLEITVPDASKTFAEFVSWMSVVLGGGVYCLMVLLLLIAKKRRPNTLRYIFHNLGYVFFLIAFSVSLFVDFFMTRTKSTHDNIALILAVIAGWWFSVFFLRAIRLFSFFTEMIRRVIIGDLLRFSVIISFMLFAFTAGMYAVFVGAVRLDQQTPAYEEAVTEHFSSFGGAMLTMFKLMLGLDDFGVLNQARIPGLAIALYIVFALLTYVLLINSLIAMMSQTCAVVLEDRYPQWRLQQLSVVLFLEDLFCLSCIRYIFGSPGTEKEIRGFDPVSKQNKIYSRYFLKIHSLQTTYASEEDREAMKKTVKEKEPIRMDGSLRSDQGTLNYLLKTAYTPSIRRRTTRRMNQPEMKTPSISIDDVDGTQRKKSPRRNKHLSRVREEEEIITKQSAAKLGSEPDLIRSEKSPQSRRRRYHSENMHEKENRKSPSVASVASDYTRSDGLLTPVENKLHVHGHLNSCPERKELFIPNGYPHVDIEPYPHASE
ncbi:transient receptor potential cation channel subfamily V member 5-like isoform X1 [Mytilus edulis]|uniref:transient receptor potential cation channel subfamily V member 5-like isoform X1 n=2 Tax=Mytilus edulis TaxID=6550 RepID=UPI0039EF19EF